MAKNAMPVLPKSVKTAYGLLSFIAKITAEEPKRMHMGEWRVTQPNWSANHIKFPACGTVGCIGGWTEILSGQIAEAILGLTNDQQEELFFPSRLTGAARQGTAAHAAKVIRHIEKFQRKYSKQLKATRLGA